MPLASTAEGIDKSVEKDVFQIPSDVTIYNTLPFDE